MSSVIDDNLQVSGALTATSFQGDGSALTGIASKWEDGPDGSIHYDGSNVGIGTTEPGNRLTIQSADQDTSPFAIKGASADNPTIIEFFDGNAVGSEGELRMYYQGNQRVRISTAGFTNFNGGNVGIGKTTDPDTELDVNGTITASDLTLTAIPETTRNLYELSIDVDGKVFADRSSIQFKEDVEPLQEDFHKILDVSPKSFVGKQSKEKSFGYIAEELDRLGLRNLVVYDNAGKPQSVVYKKLGIYAIELLKGQQKVIDRLEGEIAALKSALKLQTA